ncbi:MAG: DUF3846 domain-containing protein [Flavobacteriaceae bacterium]
MAVVLKSNGSRERDVKINSLKQMQELVGGYVEFVYLNDKVLIVNEEGLLYGLPRNNQATEIAGHPIVGDAILCGVNELN